jgi:phage shock protein A
MIQNTAPGAGGQRDDDLTGMDPASAREYIAGYAAHVKMLEKDAAKSAEDVKLWESRVSLARSQGQEALAQRAEQEAASARAKQAAAESDAADARATVEAMRRQLPGLAARARSVDPDLLQQELLMATGYLPGDEEKAAADRDLKAMTKEASADAALAALKAKMQGEKS